MVFAVLIQMGDYVTTFVGLSRGAVEVNPIMAALFAFGTPHIGGVLKAVYLVGFLAWGWYTAPKYPRLFQGFTAAHNIMMAWVVATNLHVIAQTLGA